MSLSELKEDLDKTLKPKLEEILEILKQIASNDNERLEAVAAKIINKLKSVIQEYSCNKEILEALEQKDLINSPLKVKNITKLTSLGKYTYPNHGVGNAELGSSGNPKALTWPFGEKRERSL